MRLIGDAEVRLHADPEMAAAAIEQAFREAATGTTALLARQRIVAAGLKVSAMAAILPGMGVAGAKVYTTRDGAFRFVVLLFDSATGAPLATIEADALTEIRTAAVTEVVARRMAPGTGGTLAVFGSGVQARAHVRALARALRPDRIGLVSRGEAGALCSALAAETGSPVTPMTAEAAVRDARMVVTATRSTTPLFDGGWLSPGCLVAAVGSTLPHARELDDTTLRRAGVVLVEDRAQAMAEAGDLILGAASGALDMRRVIELAPALAGDHPAGQGGDIALFKSVGIALEDVAVAAAIWQRVSAA